MKMSMFRVAVLVWAILCVYCLCRAEQEEPAYEPIPVEEVEEEEPIEVVVEEPTIEEPTVEERMEKYPSIVNATLTHYCVCKKCCGKEPDHPAYGITASGRKAEPYLSVAVDPFMIPLGSTVYIDYGDGEIHEYRADDTGGFAGAHIDLCVADHQEALELGVKTVRVGWKENGDV